MAKASVFNFNEVNIMKIACVFPGQGSQIVGMCQDVVKNFSTAKAVLQEVDDALGRKLSEIILVGPAENLAMTENTQPALMACSIAILRVIEEQSGKKLPDFCHYVAGHSLGEFTALTAAGVFSLADCAKLLQIRGRAMQASVPFGKGAMFALLGAKFSIAQEIVQKANKIGICQIANDNSDGQQVLSGTAEAIDEAMNLAVQANLKTIKLNVSAPFHCQLMQSAQEVVKQALSSITMNVPSVPLIANITAKSVTNIILIKTYLAEQVTSMVRWRESIIELKNLGINHLVEIGAGKVLTSLTKRIDQEIGTRAIQTCQDIESFVEKL